MSSRGGEVVSYEAHNLETLVQFQAPQQILAGVAQWLEQGLHKAKVIGPIPITGIRWSRSVVRSNTSPCHGEDHGFESRRDR